jgi:DNA-binding MarR family transcriptional regulator
MKEERMPNEAPLGQLLLQAFRWFDESLLLTLASRGWPELSHAQSLVFAHLDLGGTRISELARRVGVSRQAMHKTVGDLEELGLLNLVTDPTNRSAKLVRLTDKGQANVEAALDAFIDIEVELASRIGPSSVQALRLALSSSWGEPVAVIRTARG